ncbi:hypothetical protein GMO_02100 [Gluconobacter morbifer G707]|uniref:Uncharacterized protein n=1 Tax=Gluconobacter morbifer G707 TaxID=1088869 RepID=G6XFE5_9PROT|nr:hypothetical protein GMO_02100 [Gluconobacter morbifer G707]
MDGDSHIIRAQSIRNSDIAKGENAFAFQDESLSHIGPLRAWKRPV